MSTIDKLLGRTETTQPLEEVTKKDFIMMANAIKQIEDPVKRKEQAELTANVFSQQNPLFNRTRYMEACGAGMGSGDSEPLSTERTGIAKAMRSGPEWEPAHESVVAKILGKKVIDEAALEVCDVVHMICGAAGEDKEKLKKGLHALSKSQLKKIYNAITGKETLKDDEGEEKGEAKAEKKEEKKDEKVPFASGEENKAEKKEEKVAESGSSSEKASLANKEKDKTGEVKRAACAPEPKATGKAGEGSGAPSGGISKEDAKLAKKEKDKTGEVKRAEAAPQPK